MLTSLHKRHWDNSYRGRPRAPNRLAVDGNNTIIGYVWGFARYIIDYGVPIDRMEGRRNAATQSRYENHSDSASEHSRSNDRDHGAGSIRNGFPFSRLYTLKCRRSVVNTVEMSSRSARCTSVASAKSTSWSWYLLNTP